MAWADFSNFTEVYKPQFDDIEASLMELCNPNYILTRRDTNVLRRATRWHK
jgi:hypothetical protein